jgi:S1-C subfamily serine protease
MPAEANKHGYLSVSFSNEPSRSLYVAEVLRPANDPDPIMVGDLVTSYDGKKVATVKEWQQLAATSAPGDIVQVGIVRDSQPMTLRVRLLSLADAMRRLATDGPAAP